VVDGLREGCGGGNKYKNIIVGGEKQRSSQGTAVGGGNLQDKLGRGAGRRKVGKEKFAIARPRGFMNSTMSFRPAV
jgi:hypothetical protein